MLVLTRKLNQSIVIGDPASGDTAIEVTVIEVRGDGQAGSSPQVRLGIKAPQSVPVHRKEVYLQIQQERKPLENEAASQTPASG